MKDSLLLSKLPLSICKYRLGIFGGTFDPIHLGHTYAANMCLKKLKLDKVIFVPSGMPPHKQCNITAPKHRFNMVQLATKNYSKFEVSSFEFKKKKPSYTIDTIAYFRKKYGERSVFLFLIGPDALLEITTWKKWRELIKLCKFVVFDRRGYSCKKVENHLLKYGIRKGRDFDTIKINSKNISATDIRTRVKMKRNINHLVAPLVKEYIYAHKLYK